MLVALLRRRRAGPLCLTALHTAALLLFIHGFLLTRVQLEQRSGGQAAPAGRTRLVWLMVDSLRYDFVVRDGRYACQPGASPCHQGQMPYLSNLTTQVCGLKVGRTH